MNTEQRIVSNHHSGSSSSCRKQSMRKIVKEEKKKQISSSQFFQIGQVSEDISRQLSDVVHTDVPMETKEQLLVVSGWAVLFLKVNITQTFLFGYTFYGWFLLHTFQPELEEISWSYHDCFKGAPSIIPKKLFIKHKL